MPSLRKELTSFEQRWHSCRLIDGELNLRWCFYKFSEDESLRRGVRSAFSRWSEFFLLRWEEVLPSFRPDVIVQYALEEHIVKWNVIALAQMPLVSHPYLPLRILVRPDIDWEKFEPFKLFLHEVGHTLGAGHIKQKGCVMCPWYSSSGLDFTPEDVRELNGKLQPRRC